MKIIFLTNVPFIRQHRIDMYYDAISDSFDVEMWDLSEAYQRNDNVIGKEKKIVKFNSLGDFEDRLNCETRKNKIAIITGISIKDLKQVYGIIHSMGIPIININKEAFATWMGNAGSLKYINRGGIKEAIKTLLRFNPLAERLIHNIFYHNIKYDYLLSSYNFFPYENRHFIPMHHIKYDEYIAAGSQPSIIDGEYILFLDAALSDHPMFVNKPNRINRSLYLQQLRHYFDLLEKKHGVKVIISAHPKSNYTNEDLGGRSVIMYQTPVLIKHAKYVVSHYTTSLINVILENKPLKVLYSSELMHSSCRYCVAMGLKMADMIKADVVNIEKPTEEDFSINEKAYNEFKNKYIIYSREKDLRNSELIVRFLKKFASDFNNNR